MSVSPASRAEVVSAMAKAAADLGWPLWLSESTDDEVTVSVRPQCIVPGCKEPYVHAFVKVTDSGIEHLEETP